MQLPRDIRRILAKYSVALAWTFKEYDIVKKHKHRVQFNLDLYGPRCFLRHDLSRGWIMCPYSYEQFTEIYHRDRKFDIQGRWCTFAEIADLFYYLRFQ